MRQLGFGLMNLSISFPSRRSHRDHHVYDHECAFIKGDTLSVEEERGALLSMSGGSTVGNRGLVVPIPSFLFPFFFSVCVSICFAFSISFTKNSFFLLLMVLH